MLGAQPPDTEAYKCFEGPILISLIKQHVLLQLHTEDGAGGVANHPLKLYSMPIPILTY